MLKLAIKIIFFFVILSFLLSLPISLVQTGTSNVLDITIDGEIVTLKGNGISMTDADHDRIINYAINNALEVNIHEGEYILSDFNDINGLGFSTALLCTKNDVKITGVNNPVFKLNLTNSRILTVLSHNVQIKGIIFDGNNLNVYPQTSDGLLVFEGVFSGSANNCTFINGLNTDGLGTYLSANVKFNNLYITGTQHGAVFTRSNLCRMNNVVVYNVNGSGILVTGSTNCVINNSSTDITNQHGLEISPFMQYESVTNTVQNSVFRASSWLDGVIIGKYNTVMDSIFDSEIIEMDMPPIVSAGNVYINVVNGTGV